MYHALCHNNARTLAGSLRERRREDWSRVYMGMEEGTIAARFRQYRPQASDEVNDFGTAFAILQEHRDRAMEPPTSAYHPSEVIRLIQRAESAIVALEFLSNEECNVRWPSTCLSENCAARIPQRCQLSDGQRNPNELPSQFIAVRMPKDFSRSLANPTHAATS